MKKSKKSTGKRSSLSQGVLTNNSKTTTVGQSTEKPTVLQSIVENVQKEGNGNDVLPRSSLPNNNKFITHPKALSEVSLEEKDGRQNLEVSDCPGPIVADMFGCELSCENSGMEQNTESCNNESSEYLNSHVSISGGEEMRNSPDVESRLGKLETDSVDTGGNEVEENSGSASVKSASTAAKGKGSAKKKRYLPVQSRYMQQSNNSSSNNSSSSNSALELSAIPSNSEGKNKENRRLKKNTGISHSTPYVQEQALFTFSDGSFMDTTAVKKKETAATAAAAAKRDRRKTCVTTNDSRKPKEKEPTPLSELQMDIHHCRNLHMAFLLTQSRQTFEAEEQKLKEDLYAMHQANARLKQEIHEMEQKIMTKDAEIAVDMLLQAQVDGLEEMQKQLPGLTTAMSQLTSAMRNTAKYMKLKNVILDEEKHLEALAESKRLLSQVGALIVLNQPGIEGLSTAACDLQGTVLVQLEQQEVCLDLLTTYKSLNNQERSLMAQIIQGCNVE